MSDGPPGGKKTVARVIIGIFLIGWLIGWSVAIAGIVDQIIAQGLGAADAGLFVFIVVACAFWVLAVVMLWRMLTGRRLSNRTRRNWGNATQNHGGLRRGDFDDRGGDD